MEVIRSVDVRAVCNQQLHHLVVALLGCNVQRGLRLVVLVSHKLRLLLQQQLHNLVPPVLHRHVQRCLVRVVHDIELAPRVHQQACDRLEPVGARDMERAHVVLVGSLEQCRRCGDGYRVRVIIIVIVVVLSLNAQRKKVLISRSLLHVEGVEGGGVSSRCVCVCECECECACACVCVCECVCVCVCVCACVIAQVQPTLSSRKRSMSSFTTS